MKVQKKGAQGNGSTAAQSEQCIYRESHVKWDKLIIVDPEFKALIDPLTSEEYARLEQNLRDDNDCREPLVVWAGEKILLDGHNRLEICRKYGIRYTVVQRHLADREKAKEWVILNQIGRRNLKEGQRAALAARVSTLERGANQHTADAASTQTEIAERYKVSPDSIQRAKKVLRDGIPELQKAVQDGELAISTAKEIACLPEEEQRAAWAEGIAAIKAKAKEIRSRKAEDRRAKAETEGSDVGSISGQDMHSLPVELQEQLDQFWRLWNERMAEPWVALDSRAQGDFIGKLVAARG